MQTHVEFRSETFPPYEGEEEQINPGLWGKRLAEYLCENLSNKGVSVGSIFAEDWGWIVPITGKPFNMWVGCGNYQEYPDDGFLVFIEPSRPVIKKWFKKIDVSADITELADRLDAILRDDPAIRDIRWWTDDEVSGKR